MQFINNIKPNITIKVNRIFGWTYLAWNNFSQETNKNRCNFDVMHEFVTNFEHFEYIITFSFYPYSSLMLHISVAYGLLSTLTNVKHKAWCGYRLLTASWWLPIQGAVILSLVTDLCSSVMFSVQAWCWRQVMQFLIGFTYGPCWKGIQYVDSVVVGCRCTLSHLDPKAFNKKIYKEEYKSWEKYIEIYCWPL